MLRTRTFRCLRSVNKSDRQSVRHHDVINRMKARAACKQKHSEPLVHCTDCDPTSSWQGRNDEKHTSEALERKRNGSRLVLTEKPLRQKSQLKMKRQRLSMSRMIWGQVKMWDWWPESPYKDYRRWQLLSWTVWAILQVPMMRRREMMRMMKEHSRASSAKMTNPAGGCAQSPTLYRSVWRGFSRCRWSLTNWHNWDGGMQPITSVKEIISTAQRNWWFQQLFNCKQMLVKPHLHPQHLESLWHVLILSLEYCKFCNQHLNQKEIISG